MAARRSGLRHPDLAAGPCPNLLDRLAGPRVRGLHRFEEVQNVLRARGSPQSQEPMVGVGKRPPTADGDEAGVAIFREDHSFSSRLLSGWLVTPDAGRRTVGRRLLDQALPRLPAVVDGLANKRQARTNAMTSVCVTLCALFRRHRVRPRL